MAAKPFAEIPVLRGEELEIRALSPADADALQELMDSPAVYRYLPTFLFEKKYKDARQVIGRLYDECLKESLILGIYKGDSFCGLIELYGFRDEIHKISVGYRLLPRWWGQGVASEALGLMIHWLYEQTDIEIITASTMVENRASAKVLTKNGFDLVVRASKEDWGYEEPTPADKWIR